MMLNEDGGFRGYIPDLLDVLSDHLMFSYVLDFVPDGTFGFRRADGVWDGMIGQLVTDVSADEFRMEL